MASSPPTARSTEISYCYAAGFQYNQNGFFRQAAKEYVRVHQLAPDNLDARLQLAWIYVINHLPDRALEILQAPLATPAKFGLNADNSPASACWPPPHIFKR